MTNSIFTRMFFCVFLLFILSGVSRLNSAPDKEVQEVLENIGKQNPFEVVKPFMDMRKKSKPESYSQDYMPELFVETVMLKFLKATNVQDAISMMSSDYGNISTDSETNSLIVCDTAENLEKIVAQIRKADRTPRQILIEVVIVDVQLDDDSEIGFDWAHQYSPVHSTNFIQTLAGVNASSSGAAFNLIEQGIGVTVQALQTTKDVEILATPRVLVVSGKEALIKTVEEIPYTEVTDTSDGGDSAMTSTEFKEAGITLTVKAILTDEDQILLAIDAEQSINAGINSSLGINVPVVNKRIAKTDLLMRDGQVLVMSGLRQRETKLTVNKIPLLGDLPILGALFSNDNKEVKHSELLVFISPHIYKDNGLTQQQAERFGEIKDEPPLQLPNRERPIYKAADDLMPSYMD
jgi:type II secretory pathway component GspD/PulD (secretin)